MRRIFLALVSSALFCQSSFAADITKAGAEDIASAIRGVVGPAIMKAVKVQPDGERYRIDVDFGTALNSLAPNVLQITGKPISTQFVTPLENGLWKVEADQSLKYGMKSLVPPTQNKQASGSKRFAISTIGIDRIKSEGVFDQKLGYTQNLDTALFGLSWQSAFDGQVTKGEIESASAQTKAVPGKGGGINIDGTMEMKSYTTSTIVNGVQGGRVSAEKIDGYFSIADFRLKALQALIKYAGSQENISKLSDAQAESFKQLIVDSMPLTGKLVEEIRARGVTFDMPGGAGKLDSVSYRIDFDGFGNNSQAVLSITAAGLGLPDGLIPLAGAEKLIPDEMTVSAGVSGLNIQDAVDYYNAHYDFKHDGKLSDSENAEAGRVLLNGDKLNAVFPKISAKSALYEISASGSLASDLLDSKNVSAHFEINARNLDKLVPYLQEQGKKNPQFNQASFVILMAQGMAKPQSDGSMQWIVDVSPNQKVLINGNPLPFGK